MVLGLEEGPQAKEGCGGRWDSTVQRLPIPRPHGAAGQVTGARIALLKSAQWQTLTSNRQPGGVSA